MRAGGGGGRKSCGGGPGRAAGPPIRPSGGDDLHHAADTLSSGGDEYLPGAVPFVRIPGVNADEERAIRDALLKSSGLGIGDAEFDETIDDAPDRCRTERWSDRSRDDQRIDAWYHKMADTGNPGHHASDLA